MKRRSNNGLPAVQIVQGVRPVGVRNASDICGRESTEYPSATLPGSREFQASSASLTLDCSLICRWWKWRSGGGCHSSNGVSRDAVRDWVTAQLENFFMRLTVARWYCSMGSPESLKRGDTIV